MIRSDKKLRELALLIQNGDDDTICNGIEMLRREQPFEGAIGLLVSLYNDTGAVVIRKSVEQFMNDLKDQSACEEIISEIKKIRKSGTTNMLVSSCWQSGLDYSEYPFEFTEVFLRSDYATAFECLTVIEEIAASIGEDKKLEITEYLLTVSASQPEEKRALTAELISILGR